MFRTFTFRSCLSKSKNITMNNFSSGFMPRKSAQHHLYGHLMLLLSPTLMFLLCSVRFKIRKRFSFIIKPKKRLSLLVSKQAATGPTQQNKVILYSENFNWKTQISEIWSGMCMFYDLFPDSGVFSWWQYSATHGSGWVTASFWVLLGVSVWMKTFFYSVLCLQEDCLKN